MANNFNSRKHGYGNFSHNTRGRAVPGAQRSPRDRAHQAVSPYVLVDPATIGRLVATAAPAAHGHVLVPAAGDAALLRALAAHGARVTAYEPDPAAAGRLSARTRDEPGIRVLRADFTKARTPREPFAVVAVAPTTAPAILDWCLRAPALTSATLLVTQEYADAAADQASGFTGTLTPPVPADAFRPATPTSCTILHLTRP
ncbi:hypothetical protein KV205_32075 [Streptomyces sp. SKN60]|uniref:rRNA adenine N-6-methyltransferase family protein n=1 Tax=Streptomyces sp. SKN60 TaxID=2855506 RepID=UPI002248473B|nr:rRNA adenine N-6-methyltransferase family protein [Streptomyces sp. SKN60]MCX2185113.1 hypothetical protein [Streptomyces sp. SKN60]